MLVDAILRDARSRIAQRRVVLEGADARRVLTNGIEQPWSIADLTLNLGGNNIGNAGLTSLSAALANGALPQLQELDLDTNQISDAGLTSLSTALSNEAIANLQAC